MTIYTAEKQNHWPRILLLWSRSLAIFLLIIMYHILFPDQSVTLAYIITAVLSLAYFISLIDRPRIYKIIIDEKGETLARYYRSPLRGEGEKIILLDHVRIYIKKKKNNAHPEGLPATIDFYKDYRQIVKLSAKDDGFSAATLQDIVQALKKLGLNITE